MRRDTQRADPSSVRHWNEYAVIDALRSRSPQRISELAGATGLTPAPLGHVLRGLEQKGWVRSGQPTSGSRGRPAQVFSLRMPPGWVLGVDIGAHTVRAVRMDLTGQVVARADQRLRQRGTDQGRRDSVAAVLEEVCREDAGEPVWLTALAVGGHLDEDGRIVASLAVPTWNGQHPAELFGDLLPSRATVVNDVRAATWAEHVLGAARGYQEVMLVQLGRRPTLGLLFGGHPRRGAHGTAGDMSRSLLLPGEERMAWLEPFAGSPDPLGEAVQAALGGDRTVLDGATAFVSSITPALAFATSVVDPGILVVGGALSPLADHFLEGLARDLAGYVQQTPTVATSELDQYATAIGAGLLAGRQVLDTLATPTNGVAALTPEEFARLDLSRS